MAIVSFTEAAKLCGHKSRSTLYRLRDAGALRAHLIPPEREGAAAMIETHPEGARPLLDLVRACVRTQANSRPLRGDELEQRRAALAERNRWAVVAGALSAALEAAGLTLQLSGPEARTIAAALPDALGEALGVAGLDALATDTAAARDRIEPPPAPADPPAIGDEPDPFWGRYGRIAGPDEPPLSPDEAEEHAGLMAWHLAQQADPTEPPPAGARFWLWEVEHQAADAREAVAAGARWDRDRWDEASARTLLEDLPDDGSAAELAQLLAAGRIPAGLLAEVRAALSQPPMPVAL